MTKPEQPQATTDALWRIETARDAMHSATDEFWRVVSVEIAHGRARWTTPNAPIALVAELLRLDRATIYRQIAQAKQRWHDATR